MKSDQWLVIGDPHLKLSRLQDAEFFIANLLAIIRERRPVRTVILGDGFDTFAVIRTEILSLWNRFVDEVGDITQLTWVLGNHEMAGPSGGAHALETFRSRIQVIDAPHQEGNVWFVPFMRDKAEFETFCRTIPAGSVLFGHQSIQGCTYENGFYDPNGADPKCVQHLSQAILGHIHLAQAFANVWYPGSPFQQGFGDAGHDKYIYLGEMTGQGFQTVEKIQLEMPRYEVIEVPTTRQLLEALPEPVEQNNYKLVATGTPLEIQEFWQDPKAQAFRKAVRRCEDALVSKQPETILQQVKGETLQERLEAFIKTKNWKVPHAELTAAAGRLLAA
jgi:DNA repair exonuclease SbcCD nuclease subunit